MFGCIVAGRQVFHRDPYVIYLIFGIDTDKFTASGTRKVCFHPSRAHKNQSSRHLHHGYMNISWLKRYIYIFIEPFDAGFGASLYYNTARQQASGAAWQFLGILANDKPSAIFRVKQSNANSMEDILSDNETEDYGELGISIEPLSVLEPLVNEKALQVATTTQSQANETKSILQKLAENAFNYLSSFAKPAVMYGSEQVVPIKCLEEWFNSTLRKAVADPQFALK